MRGEGIVYDQCTTMCIIHMHICRGLLTGGGGCHSFLGVCSLKLDASGFGSHFLCFPSSSFSLSMNADKMLYNLVTYIYVYSSSVLSWIVPTYHLQLFIILHTRFWELADYWSTSVCSCWLRVYIWLAIHFSFLKLFN